MIRLISNGQYPQLVPLLKETDYTTATALVTCMDRKKRDEFGQKIAEVIADSSHAGNNVDSFQRFLDRFRAGPSPTAPQDMEVDADDNVVQRDDNAGNTNKGKKPAHVPDLEIIGTSERRPRPSDSSGQS